jgi:ABC-type molybdate transport system substrate-binding protein
MTEANPNIYPCVVVVLVLFVVLVLLVVFGVTTGVVHTPHFDEVELHVYVYPETEKQLAEVNVLASVALHVAF